MHKPKQGKGVEGKGIERRRRSVASRRHLDSLDGAEFDENEPSKENGRLASSNDDSHAAEDGGTHLDIYTQGATEEDVLQRIHESYFAPIRKDDLELLAPCTELSDSRDSHLWIVPTFGQRTDAHQWRELVRRWPEAAQNGAELEYGIGSHFELCCRNGGQAALLPDLAHDKDIHLQAILSHEERTVVCELQVRYAAANKAGAPSTSWSSRTGSGANDADSSECHVIWRDAPNKQRESIEFPEELKAASTGMCISGMLPLNTEGEMEAETDEVLAMLTASQDKLRDVLERSQQRRAAVRHKLEAELVAAQQGGTAQTDGDLKLERIFWKHSCWAKLVRLLQSGVSDKVVAVEDDEPLCSVCFDGESTASNPITFCDKCNIGVHASCYGLKGGATIDEWFCERCESAEQRVQCTLCPIEDGALKATVDGRWAHLFCTVFVPEAKIDDVTKMAPLSGMTEARIARPELQCAICFESSGARIRCSHDGCSVGFHVLCAWYNGYSFVVNQRKAAMTSVDASFHVYCCTHSPDAQSRDVRVQVLHRSRARSDLNNTKRRKKQGLGDQGRGLSLGVRPRLMQEDRYQASVCAVCFDVEGGRPLLECKVCGITLHLACAGMPSVDVEYTCGKCIHGLTTVPCALCPRRGGAVQQTSDARWVHRACLLWLHKGSAALPPITDAVNISQIISSCSSICYICKRQYGVCVTCHLDKCDRAFHILCARFASCKLDLNISEQRQIVSSAAFCRKHSPQPKIELPEGYRNLVDVRSALDKVRMLMDMLRRREKLKKRLLRIQSETMQRFREHGAVDVIAEDTDGLETDDDDDGAGCVLNCAEVRRWLGESLDTAPHVALPSDNSARVSFKFACSETTAGTDASLESHQQSTSFPSSAADLARRSEMSLDKQTSIVYPTSGVEPGRPRDDRGLADSLSATPSGAAALDSTDSDADMADGGRKRHVLDAFPQSQAKRSRNRNASTKSDSGFMPVDVLSLTLTDDFTNIDPNSPHDASLLRHIVRLCIVDLNSRLGSL